MRVLLVFVALVSIQAYAYDDVPMYPVESSNYGNRLEPILEQPVFVPIEYPKPVVEPEPPLRVECGATYRCP